MQRETYYTEQQYLALLLVTGISASDQLYSNSVIFKVASNPSHAMIL